MLDAFISHQIEPSQRTLIRKSELCVRQAGQIRLPAELTDIGCGRLAAGMRFARRLIVDKPNAPLHFWTHLIWFVKLFRQHMQEARIKWRMLLACRKMLRFGIPRHARPASIGENSGEILRSVYVRLNIAVEFEDNLGKRAMAPSSGRLRGNPKDRQSALASSYLAADN
jgi:hypothetical protein